MAKYRKKPVVIEAVQYQGQHVDGVCDGECRGVPGDSPPHIHTLEGSMDVTMGDWIITGVAGERYPCKDNIFRQTYEEVDA